MKPKAVKTYAPATISNLGPGFDTLGVAIDSPGDTVVARRRPDPGLGFSVASNDTAVPHDVQQLVVIDYRAMQNSTAAMDLRDRVMPPELKQRRADAGITCPLLDFRSLSFKSTR